MLVEDPIFRRDKRKVGSMHYAVGRKHERDFYVNPAGTVTADSKSLSKIDELARSQKAPVIVIPVKTGIQEN